MLLCWSFLLYKNRYLSWLSPSHPLIWTWDMAHSPRSFDLGWASGSVSILVGLVLCLWIHDYKWHFLLGLSYAKLLFPITLYHSHSFLKSSTTGASTQSIFLCLLYSSQFRKANYSFVRWHNVLVTCLPSWRYSMHLGNKVNKLPITVCHPWADHVEKLTLWVIADAVQVFL